MARLALLAAIAVAATAAVVLAGAGNHRVFMEEMRGMAHGWSRGARADPNTKLHLTVAVKQTNTDVLEATLIRISDPEHPDFNKLMSDKEVHALVAPRPESIAAVKKWMHVYGIEESQMTFSPNSDFISAVVTVATAEKMLETEYYTFHHKSGKTMTRVNKYTLPAYVAGEVDFVAPTVRLPVVQAVRPANRPEDDDFGSVTPSFLRTLYGVGSYSASAAGNRQSCSSFLEQYYAPSDLQSFFQQYDTEANGRTPTVTGPNDSTNPGTEASLDIQYIMAMGNNVPTTFWSTPGTQPNNPENEPFLVWLQNVDATADAQVPWTFSVSYGDNENTVNFAYAVRVNTEFQKAGVRGISIMFSSGDGGVAGGQTTDCTVFIPTFPAGSPWVTSVGGTTSSGPETAASFSSGGFSNYWARPSWQDAAVSQYFKVAQNLPASNLYNQTGAGIPDVSAQAEGFMVYQGGFAQPVDGTSCSSPTFTGIMSLINDQRMKAGKKPLGYLNQIFYKNPDVFTDITTGNNPGCNTNGFQAAAGWDPVTGLGTPNFSKLTQLALSLP